MHFKSNLVNPLKKLFETIKIIDGKAQFLNFHQARFDKTRNILFPKARKISLQAVIQPPSQKGIYRCRLVYATEIEQIEYLLYQERLFKRFQLVNDDKIDYSFKYVQRAQINRLFQLKQNADDIIIIKQGMVTDTSIANIAFLYNNQWVTPEKPLLAGTTRQRLLEAGTITTQTIKVADLQKFSKMAMMNALVGFHFIEAVEFC